MPKPINAPIPKLPIGQIRWFVDKHHVSASLLTIARDMRKRSIPSRVPDWTWAARRAAMRYAINVHLQNRGLYRSVMSGRW